MSDLTNNHLAQNKSSEQSSVAKPSEITLNNLNASDIVLTGKHLIEASAGTGKTYNITRIYLRLLLERELTVEQILLMTFTKDATQELRGRIDTFIRQALNDWDTLCNDKGSDGEFFRSVDKKIAADKRQFLLKRALLFLDEAAIFTIHGFCQRVLNQYAFTSGLPFNANMAADTKEITLQACQDWYRQVAKNTPEQFNLLVSFWETPNSFLSSFSKALGHTSELSLIDVETIKLQFSQLARQAKSDLSANHALLETALILVKKGADQDKRRAELAELNVWLESITEQLSPSNDSVSSDSANSDSVSTGIELTKMPDAFIDGKRYARSKFKEELLAAFESVKEVKEQTKKIASKVSKAQAYEVVRAGVYQIRAKIIEQKQLFNMLDFDDLINTLANCLADDEQGVLASQLLTQFPVALVDEFQDTDPKQFGILQAIYYGEAATKAKAGLFLIGDPKQAIYGFRGGDIFAYLNARHGCDYHWLMDTNWRSTPEMIAGYNQVFSSKVTVTEPEPAADAVFGYSIPYLPVLSGKTSLKQALNDDVTEGTNEGINEDTNEYVTESLGQLELAESEKALQFIHFTDDLAEGEAGKVGQSSRKHLATWCATEISQLLSVNIASKSKVSKGNAPESKASESTAAKPIRPKDIALLVRDGSEAREIKQALQLAGLDSVFMSDRANLFYSEQAGQLLSLLKGILYVENERLFVAALGSGLLGFSAEKLTKLQQHEQAYQTMKFAFIDYRQQWQRQGFITMAVHLMHQHFDVCETDKDRSLTNLLHLFEVLQAASQRHHQGQELLFWFEQQCRLDNPETEAELRLESDSDLIRIITQHGSKGLEYPYVFVPFATRHKDPLRFGAKSVSYIEYHDEQGKLMLSLDGSNEAKKAMSDEAYAESIRLLYVAITRAEKRCYILTTSFDKCHLSPLGKTLKWQESQNISQSLEQLKTLAPEAIGISYECYSDYVGENIGESTNQSTETVRSLHAQVQHNNIANLQASKFTGSIERDWWLSSFTALTRNIRHSGVSTPDRDADLYDTSETGLAAQSIRFKLAKGAHSGNLLHDILERTDFSDPHWQESLELPLVKYGSLNQITYSNQKDNNTNFTEDDLITWLEDILAAPFIGDTFIGDGKASLADLSLSQTMRESEFYFPMQGEHSDALAELLKKHRWNKLKKATSEAGQFNTAQSLPSEFNMSQQSTSTDSISQTSMPVHLPTYKKLSGMMHGFIDLVFEHQGKYYVCDYKSSHLGDRHSDYQHKALHDNIEANYYDLQYLIYSLALHRHLQQCVPDYDANEHFGGIYYLYLRGMSASAEHAAAGVYFSKVTHDELTQLDQLFSGKESVKTSVKDSSNEPNETQTSAQEGNHE